MDRNMMIKQAMPFIPLADKTGLNARHANIPSKYDTQKKFESEYIHPILGKLEANWPAWIMGKDTKTLSAYRVPMKEVYDKIIQALGYTHNDITKDPNYINKLNAFRSSPNSQLLPIPESVNFLYWPEVPGYNLPMYSSMLNDVYSSPMDLDSINKSRAFKDTNGMADYFKNYNHYDRNKYNSTLTAVVAHEALGHAGNFPKYYLGFYGPIAKREGKSIEEIVPLYRKFWPTYWGPSGGEAEFTLSLHAVKRQGREWGYPVDSDNDEEVVLAFRDTINRLLKMPLDQARKLPLESQRFRSYLNNARLYNSYKEDPDGNWFINDLRKKYNKFKSLHAEDQNNPHLMDQITEDVLYYTTPETLKGLLSHNNTQVNKYGYV